MQIRSLRIQNFRGVSSLDWKPNSQFCCLIGPGDSGKSTILDAIEACLSSRWFSFTEADFLNCDPSKRIEIEITVGELSKSLLSDERFGLYIRGWTSRDSVRDEPESDDEAVLTLRLTVDATMEPAWELICDRFEEPRPISNRDRALFGLVRLSGEDARHLTWSQGSVLSRLTAESDEAAARLAEAHRAARASAKLHEITALSDAAKLAERFAKGLGAYVDGAYAPAIELGRGGLSTSAIALHDSDVPLRLAGTGTRRLATLAIQMSAVRDGAIVLIDEIEHGLEPHRIAAAISQLKAGQSSSAAASKPIGQILMTTHSEVALSELDARSLRVVRTIRQSRSSTVLTAEDEAALKAILRFAPRSLFSRRVVVVEGQTELGLLLGLREQWPPTHGGLPIEYQGSSFADGNGFQAVSIALAFVFLGYKTAIFRDSDKALADDDRTMLELLEVPVFEYGDSLNTESAIFSVASDSEIQRLLTCFRAEHGGNPVNDAILSRLPGLGIASIRESFDLWEILGSYSASQLRDGLSVTANAKKWLKNQRAARDASPIVWDISQRDRVSPLARALSQVETWTYG